MIALPGRAIPTHPEMNQFQSRVQILAQVTLHHVHSTTAEDARWLCDRRLAIPLFNEFTACGQIELTVSIAELREVRDYIQRNRKGPPKRPLRAPESSTGDAGRGWTHGARRQAIIFWPRVHERMESGAVRAEPMRAEA
jgi:hypothetical protein